MGLNDDELTMNSKISVFCLREWTRQRSAVAWRDKGIHVAIASNSPLKSRLCSERIGGHGLAMGCHSKFFWKYSISSHSNL